jgi:plasmid stability protein
MPVTLSVKNVSDELAARLRERAARNHRSLQGELLSILEVAAWGSPRLDASDLLERVRALGLRTGREASGMIRGDRDAR